MKAEKIASPGGFQESVSRRRPKKSSGFRGSGVEANIDLPAIRRSPIQLLSGYCLSFWDFGFGRFKPAVEILNDGLV
jgi:hypothetical protein